MKVPRIHPIVLLTIIWTFLPGAWCAAAIDPQDLMKMDLEELMNVTIASKKSEPLVEAPGVVTVVPREEFEVYGDRDLWQLMQRQPSVYTREVFPYSDNLAGFRGDMLTVAEMHTLILFNGRPIRESAQGLNVNMYDAFPLTALDGVELVRGPGSVLYGSNAFTGVVNLKSREVPEQPTFAVSALGGSHGYYQTTVSGGGRAGELGVTADLQVAGDDGYTSRMFDGMGVYGSARDYHQSISGVTHLKYGGLTFDVFGSDIDNFALGVTPFWGNTHHGIRNQKWFSNLGYRVPVHDRVTVELNATYNLQENVLSSPAPQRIGTNTSDLLGEVTVFVNPVDPVNLVLGYLREYRTNYSADKDYFQSIPTYRYEPQSAYAQGDWRVNKYVKLIAGMQWNESSQKQDDVVNRYGVILSPFDKWGLKLLRGEAFRAPVTLESDLADPLLMGNKNLKPETITTYDAQLFYHDEKAYAAVTYFDSTIEDLIIYNTSASPMTYMNGGEHTFHGIEFEAKYFLTPNWHVLGSAMHQQNNPDTGLNPTVVPDDMLKFGTAYAWDWGSVALFYAFFGTPPKIASPVTVNPAPDSVHLVSLNVRIDPYKWINCKKGRCIVTLRGENLLNEQVYVPTFAYTGVPNSFPYGPGITFYGGLTVTF
jgi:outer membrane receptor for ferrienterochelin and colicins